MSGSTALVGILVAVTVGCATDFRSTGRLASISQVDTAVGSSRGPVGGWSERFSRRGLRPDREPLVQLVVAQVAASLRAGAGPAVAWSRVPGVVVDGSGVPVESALAVVLGAAPPAAAVTAACRLAYEVGAPLAEVLEQVGRSIAAEAESRADRETALAGPRATARVLLWLPLAGVLLSFALGANPVAAASDGGLGTAGLVVGVMFLFGGRRWSARLIERARTAGAGS